MKSAYIYIFSFIMFLSCKKEEPVPTPIQTNNSINDIFSILNSANTPLSSNDIQTVFASSNKLYLASVNELAVVTNNQWYITTYSHSAYINNTVNCIAANDSILFCGTNNGLFKITGFDTVIINMGNPLNNIRSLCLVDTILWIGTASGGGLAKYSLITGTVTNTYLPSNSNIPNASIGKIAADGTNIWLATASGISFFDGTSFINYSKSTSGLPNNSVYDIFVVDSQKIWIAHNGGISFFDNGTFSNYNMNTSGLSLNLTRCILMLNGKVYIGTYGQGLDIFDVNINTFSHYNINNSNISNNYLSAFTLLNNKLYIASQDGVNYLSVN